MQTMGGEVSECLRYWGPPRIRGLNRNTGRWDESASGNMGFPIVFSSAKCLQEALEILKENNDWISVVISLLNLG